MRFISQQEPVLLTDEQMREFIVNGYLVLQPSVPDELHQTIFRKLTESISQGFNPGNNILPLVSEMRHILNSPEVRGALISVLGEDYFEHPHRYCHHLDPVEERPPDPEAKLVANCHQDAYSPLARARQHYLRYARIMYYPQDTPIELGPTHVIPGTQFNKVLTDGDRARAIPVAGKAGTISLTHFDIGHAAGVNLVNRLRHMVKFIYVRASEPVAPAWNCQSTQWQKPAHIHTPYDLEVAWSHHWDWLCGVQDRYKSLRGQGHGPTNGDAAGLVEALAGDRDLDTRLAATRDLAALGGAAAAAIPTLVGMLDNDHQAARPAALYALGALGEKALQPLMDRLIEAGRREDEHPEFPSWNERAISMEAAAHALAALGAPAVGPLVEVLEKGREWSRINAAFALGEMDSRAAAAVPSLVCCLDDPSSRLVRTVADALGLIRRGVPVVGLGRLLVEERPGWDEVLQRGWTARDQVRFNAAMACVRLGREAAPAEDSLLQALDDGCGQVRTLAMSALTRLDSPRAAQGVVDYLQVQRWDETIKKGSPY